MYLCTCDIDIVYAWLWLNMYMWTWQSSVFWYSTNQETAERRNPSDESWDLSSTWEARIIHAADIDILVLGSSRTAPTSPPGATAPTTTYRVTGFCWAFYHQWQMTSICLPGSHQTNACIQQLQLSPAPKTTISNPQSACHPGPTWDPTNLTSPTGWVSNSMTLLSTCRVSVSNLNKDVMLLDVAKCSCIMLCFGCPSTNNFPTFLFWWQINACWPGCVWKQWCNGI